MILEDGFTFSDAQAVTATALGEDVFDRGSGAVDADFGAGQPLYLVVQVNTTCTAGGAATVVIALETGTAATLGTVLIQSTTIAVADLVKGARFTWQLPSHGNTDAQLAYKRYLGVRYTVATGPLTAGKFDAFLTPTPSSVGNVYADAI